MKPKDEKLTLNVNLERKPSYLAHKPCVIEKAIAVSHNQFIRLVIAPLRDEQLIAQNKEYMHYDSSDEKYHCILVYDRDYGDGIVINSEGSNYSRYAQYVPQAKVIYENYLDSHLHEMRFCFPIEIYQHIPNYPKDGCILDNEKMSKYADDINIFIRENDLPEEVARGLMYWYHPDGADDEIDNKVYSAHCSVEVINGELTGVITAKIIGELSDEALERFTKYCVIQLSDAWGESMSQKYMRMDGGEVTISFWSSDEYWKLLPEDEYMSENTEDMEMKM